MLAGHDGTDASLTFRDGRKRYARCHDSGIEESTGEIHSATAVANNDGSYWSFAFGSGVAAYVEAGVSELLFEVVGVVPETLDAIGLAFENVEGGDARCGDGGRMRRGEKEGTGSVIEIVDEIATPTDVAAQGADGL